MEFITKQDFFSMVNQQKAILEIGKLGNPLFRNSKNIDVYTKEELVARYQSDPDVDKQEIADVDYLVRDNDWTVIPDKFDYIASSHNIEHVPCLVSFFRNAAHVLKPGGQIFAVIPDYRYCFDTDKLPSTILDVMEARYLNRKKPGIRIVLEHILLHNPVNDPAVHWGKGAYQLTAGKYSEIAPEQLKRALANDFSKYHDAHCWKFTPESFQYIVSMLYEIGEIDFRMVKLYPTRPGTFEFFVILEKTVQTIDNK